MNQTNYHVKNHLRFPEIKHLIKGIKIKTTNGQIACAKKEKLLTDLKTTINKYVVKPSKILLNILNQINVIIYESIFKKLILELKNLHLRKDLLQSVFFLNQNIQNRLNSLNFIYTLLDVRCNLKFNLYGRNIKNFA